VATVNMCNKSPNTMKYYNCEKLHAVNCES